MDRRAAILAVGRASQDIRRDCERFLLKVLAGRIGVGFWSTDCFGRAGGTTTERRSTAGQLRTRRSPAPFQWNGRSGRHPPGEVFGYNHVPHGGGSGSGVNSLSRNRAAQFSRWGLARRSIPAQQPVAESTRPSSPGGGSAVDPSRLNRVATRRSSLRFGRNRLAIPPSRALSAGPPPGGLAPPGELGLRPTGRTGRARRSPGFRQRLLTP